MAVDGDGDGEGGVWLWFFERERGIWRDDVGLRCGVGVGEVCGVFWRGWVVVVRDGNGKERKGRRRGGDIGLETWCFVG